MSRNSSRGDYRARCTLPVDAHRSLSGLAVCGPGIVQTRKEICVAVHSTDDDFVCSRRDFRLRGSGTSIVSAKFMVRNFKYAVLLAAIVGMVATPTTDVMNMMLVTIPIIALYAVSILIALVVGKKTVED